MNISIRKADSFNTTRWSGGTTTELFIYPPLSNYQKRDFQFRLSTATVEIDSSEFTPLPTVSRKLLLLDGEMTLKHDQKNSQHLKKFDLAVFQGDWKTTSDGRCTDFNLMTRGAKSGHVFGKSLLEQSTMEMAVSSEANWHFVYVYLGQIHVLIGDQKVPLKNGDLLIIEKPIETSIEIFSEESSELVFVSY